MEDIRWISFVIWSRIVQKTYKGRPVTDWLQILENYDSPNNLSIDWLNGGGGVLGIMLL